MEIKHLNKFSKVMAKEACRDVGVKIKDIKYYISVKQAIGVVKQHCVISDGKWVVSQKRMDKIYKDLCDWIYGVQLAKLSGEDKLDCYWDDKQNAMVFKKK